MARTINHLDRVSESFDMLDPMAQVDIVAELFTRLDAGQASHAMMLMSFWCKRQARHAGSEVPPLMDKSEVEAAGKLALSPVSEVKQ